jgi:7-cyano-7-deazaguanine synthase
MTAKVPEAVVLLSGGIDSAACVAFLQRQGNSVSAIFVDYGQAAADKERDAAASISDYYRIHLSQIRCEGASPKLDGFIQGRNAFLIFLALTQMPFESRILSLGAHSGTSYWDCSSQFAKLVQSMLDGYTGGLVRLSLPFLDWNKREIWDYCNENGVPVGLSYSCELGEEQPCGKCSSCRDLEVLHAF